MHAVLYKITSKALCIGLLFSNMRLAAESAPSPLLWPPLWRGGGGCLDRGDVALPVCMAMRRLGQFQQATGTSYPVTPPPSRPTTNNPKSTPKPHPQPGIPPTALPSKTITKTKTSTSNEQRATGEERSARKFKSVQDARLGALQSRRRGSSWRNCRAALGMPGAALAPGISKPRRLPAWPVGAGLGGGGGAPPAEGRSQLFCAAAARRGVNRLSACASISCYLCVAVALAVSKALTSGHPRRSLSRTQPGLRGRGGAAKVPVPPC
jgi:hypothetical protein